MINSQVSFTALLAVGVANACGSADALSTRIVRDSAGIEIVEHSLASATVLQLSASPVVEATAGAAGELFFVTDATILSDGSIAVASTGTHEVMIFSSQGELTTRRGRRGGGPGEFEYPEGVFELAFDRVLVSDPIQSRISIFDRAGTLLDDAPLPVTGHPSRVVGLLNGSSVAIGRTTVELSPTGFLPQIMQYMKYDWATGNAVPIIEVPSGTIGHVGAGEPWGRVTGALFEATAHGAVHNNVLVVGDGLSAELRFYDPSNNELIRILRWDGVALEVTDVDVELYGERLMALIREGERRALLRIQLDALPVAARFPVFGKVQVDRVGRVWVQQNLRPSDHYQIWHAFDLDETKVYSLQLPANAVWMDATTEQLLILERDELDVEHVRLYGLSQVR